MQRIKKIFQRYFTKSITLLPENYFIPNKYLISDKLKDGLKKMKLKN